MRKKGLLCGAGHPCDDGAERVRDEQRTLSPMPSQSSDANYKGSSKTM